MDEAIQRHQVIDEATQRELDELIEEQLYVHGSDNPVTPLVSVLLSEKHYLVWKNAIVPALEPKLKLEFVDGTFPKPSEGTLKCIKWNRANSMVYSWLKSSLIPEIANMFKFVHDSRTLWRELEQRYGTTTAPQLFELKHELTLVKQGSMSISQYYGKLKRLWDQYEQLKPTLVLDGEIGNLLFIRCRENKNMEFLMVLNEIFEHEKNQILFMEPITYNMNPAHYGKVRVVMR